MGITSKIGFVRVSGSAEEKQAAEILREEVEARGEKARLEMFEVAGQIIKKVSCATEKKQLSGHGLRQLRRNR